MKLKNWKRVIAQDEIGRKGTEYRHASGTFRVEEDLSGWNLLIRDTKLSSGWRFVSEHATSRAAREASESVS